MVFQSFITHHWVSGSAPGIAQHGVYKLHSPQSYVGSSSMDLVILMWTMHHNTADHGSDGACWRKQSDCGWDKTVAEFRSWGFGGDSSDSFLGSEQMSLKRSQIERQTLCHKNASSVACGCFNAHTVLVLHVNPFDNESFNRQRTYGKNHTKSDDRYYLMWAKPVQKGQGNFHSRGVIGQSLRLGRRRFCVWCRDLTSPGVSQVFSDKSTALCALCIPIWKMGILPDVVCR